MKPTAILAGIIVILGLIWSHFHGREETKNYQPLAFSTIQACAATHGFADSAVTHETLTHLVNGGIHVVSVDSLHKILGDQQPVAAITHTFIDTLSHDTTVTIFLAAPRQDYLEHEIANAFVARHRLAVLDTALKAQTSLFYRTCVRYCPKCTGAY